MAAGSATIPAGTYGAGLTTFGPVTVAGTLSKASASIDITQHTNPAIVLTVEIEYSADGGVTWRNMGGFERKGGPVGHLPDGNPANSVVIEITYPPQPNRRIRCLVSITGGSITTSGGVLSWQ